MKAIICSAVGFLYLSTAAWGQGFVNLGFEDATIQPLPPDGINLSWSFAAPGWDHSDGFSTDTIYYREGHLGVSQIFLMLDSTSPVSSPGTQLDGNFSLAFASGYLLNDPFSTWVYAFISQTGLIPSDTLSLRLLATGPLDVFVGGTKIAMFPVGGDAYVGDISAFAGTSSELRLMNTATVGQFQDFSVVDSIVFSTSSIPEPSAGVLAILGATVLGAQFFREKRRPQ